MPTEKQKKILKVLKEQGRMSTTKLTFIAFGHMNSWLIRKELEELVDKGKVDKEEETNATYWKIKGKSK